MIRFNLLNNARDSLRQAVQALAFDDARNLESKIKHSIVNTAHCVELLLKERLRRFDPAQVLQRPGEFPKISAYTVSVENAIKRLKVHEVVNFTTYDTTVIKNLCVARNAIMHFEWEIEARNAKVIVGEGLAFIFSFANTELGIDLAKEFQEDDTWGILLEELYQFTESFGKRIQSAVSGRPKPATDGRVKTSHLRQRRNCHAPFSSPVAKGANTWQTYSKWLQSLTSLH